MISANEIRNRQIKVVQVGYDKDEVNTLLDEAADTVDSYVAESGELYHKMEILAAKIEEYREEEDSIKAALISAEKMAEQIKRESKEKAQAILDDANAQAAEIIAKANAELDDASTRAKNILIDTNAQSEQILAESNTKANEIVTGAEKKANEAINSAKIVAQNVLDQAREISGDLVEKSREEKEAYELLIKTLKEDAREFIEKLKGLYNEQLDFLGSAKLESSSSVTESDIESIHSEVESLVSEIDEMEEAIPSSISIDDVDDKQDEDEEPANDIQDTEETAEPEDTSHDEIIASFNKNIEIEKEKVFAEIENDSTQDSDIEEPSQEQDDDQLDFEIIEDEVGEYTQDDTDESAEEEIPESELDDTPLDNVDLDDEPADPREALEAFSRNQRSRSSDTEPKEAEASLFDENEMPFESYFNVKREDSHYDRTQTISLIPPEDDEEDDEPRFRGFFKKRK